MVKSRATAEARMKRNIVGAGESLKEGFREAEDPVKKLLKDPDATNKKIQAGINEAVRRGTIIGGLKKADGRGSWINSTDRAASHFEERKDDMVKHAMADYDARAKCIEDVKKALEKEPTATRDQRIAKSAKYQKLVGECMDKLYGRTA